jgi:hypothetical protein
MPEYRFFETKQIVYDTLVIADSEEEARQKYDEIDDSEKGFNDSDTIRLHVCQPVPKNA